MSSKIYKNFLKFIMCLFLVFAVRQIYSQETWTATSTTNPPSSRDFHTAVWTGSKMIVWGGRDSSNTSSLNTGGIYDILADTWAPTSTTNAPSARYIHTAVWTGSKMIVWGGLLPNGVTNTGGSYDPITNSWLATSTTNAPSVRGRHTAIWTGSKMIVWGGEDSSNTYLNTGGIYDPATDTWAATSTTNAPSNRWDHSAVWTGSKMIVWGGSISGTYTNTGGVYDPVTNTWTTTSTANAPSIRTLHTAVWTGTKMIVWGGHNNSVLNTGGIYDPATDTWTATSTTNAPSPRANFTAVWTGTKMIVWGGTTLPNNTNTGGIYDPATDTWTATSTTNAPSAREIHTAVWTGSKMIVWGADFVLNTGGVYSNPAVIGIEKISNIVPTGFSLSQNYPNPFNPNSKIKFQIAKPGDTKLIVFDVLGREVSTLVNENLNPGTYEVDFDGSKFSSGVYFYKLTAGSYTETKKMLLVK